jgi:hypothetical protein
MLGFMLKGYDIHKKKKVITGQKGRGKSAQNTTVTKSAAYASYKIKATT